MNAIHRCRNSSNGNRTACCRYSIRVVRREFVLKVAAYVRAYQWLSLSVMNSKMAIVVRCLENGYCAALPIVCTAICILYVIPLRSIELNVIPLHIRPITKAICDRQHGRVFAHALIQVKLINLEVACTLYRNILRINFKRIACNPCIVTCNYAGTTITRPP